VKNPRKQVKISACLSLIKIKKMYLEVALHCLQEQISKDTFDRELIYCLCDYITAINKVISWFTAFVEKAEGESVEVVYAQAIVAKSYVANFKLLKKILMQDYNIFVEIN
jgi:hypothetical protein